MTSLDTFWLTADQCRARAALIRQTAEGMQVEQVRLHLVTLAQRYDEMVARMDRSPEQAAKLMRRHC